MVVYSLLIYYIKLSYNKINFYYKNKFFFLKNYIKGGEKEKLIVYIAVLF